MRCVYVCDGVTLHLLYSLITHSSYRYFSEPGTTLSNICQEADSVIITSCIKQEKPHSHHLSAVLSINTILLTVVKLTNDNFILGFSGWHTANNYQHTHTDNEVESEATSRLRHDTLSAVIWRCASKVFQQQQQQLSGTKKQINPRLTCCFLHGGGHNNRDTSVV